MKKFVLISLFLIFCISIAYTKPKANIWDGAAECITVYLKNNLDYPKSLRIFDVYEMTSVGEDYIQRVTYKAKNSMGKVRLEDDVFLMRKAKNGQNQYEVYEVWNYKEFKKLSQAVKNS